MATARGVLTVTDISDGANGAPGTPGSNGDDGDNSRTVYLFQNGTTTPSSPGTSATAGFNTSGVAVAVNGWATSATVPPAGQTIFVASRNIRQPNGTGNWVQDGAWQVNPAAASGTNGTNGDDGDDGAPGANGSDAPRFAEATLYTNPAVATAPSAPSATITWSTGALSSITTGWSQTPPTQVASSTDVIYSSQLIFIDTTAPFTTTTDTGTAPVQGTSFGGLVSFTGGNFALGGATITNIDGGNITTGTVSADKIDIDEAITLTGATSSFIAGRTGASDFGTDGFFIGRTSTSGNAADGFQLSHTSVTGSGHTLASGTVQGVIHDDTQGLRLYEPVFYQRGTGAGSDVTLDAAAETATLAAGEIHAVTLWGGGGGGGGGADSGGTAANAGTAGGTSTVQLTGATGFNGTRTFNATGGAGGAGGAGRDDNGTVSASGGSGGATAWGAGGAGGAGVGGTQTGQAGSAPASGVFGAGGGGGSGGVHGNRMDAGFPGIGGAAASPNSFTFDLTNANTDGTLTLNALGAAGAAGNNNNSNSDDNRHGGVGGAGSAGVASISGVLDGYTSSTLADLTPPSTFFFDSNTTNTWTNAGGNAFNVSGGTNGAWFFGSGLARGGNTSANRGLATLTLNGLGGWFVNENNAGSTVNSANVGVSRTIAGGNGNNANSSGAIMGWIPPLGTLVGSVKEVNQDSVSVQYRVL